MNASRDPTTSAAAAVDATPGRSSKRDRALHAGGREDRRSTAHAAAHHAPTAARASMRAPPGRTRAITMAPARVPTNAAATVPAPRGLCVRAIRSATRGPTIRAAGRTSTKVARYTAVSADCFCGRNGAGSRVDGTASSTSTMRTTKHATARASAIASAAPKPALRDGVGVGPAREAGTARGCLVSGVVAILGGPSRATGALAARDRPSTRG